MKLPDTLHPARTSIALVLFGVCATEATDLGRWKTLIRVIQERGYAIKPTSDKSVHGFVAIDHSWKHLLKVRKNVSKTHRILVLREGRVVRPDQYRKVVLARYGTIFSSSSVDIPGVKLASYADGFLPRVGAPIDNSYRLPNSLCIVNTNKFSLHPQSNYSFRQQVIVGALATGFHVSIVGKGWSLNFGEYAAQQIKATLDAILRASPVSLKQLRMPLPRSRITGLSIHGFLDDSKSIMGEHDYALVIENDCARVTEKIFDAVHAGCIPIYMGPELSQAEIPGSAYVRLYPNIELTRQLKAAYEMPREQRETIRRAGRMWLEQKDTLLRWSEEESMYKLWDGIERVLVPISAN